MFCALIQFGSLIISQDLWWSRNFNILFLLSNLLLLSLSINFLLSDGGTLNLLFFILDNLATISSLLTLIFLNILNFDDIPLVITH